jgi:hypothetical protein
LPYSLLNFLKFFDFNDLRIDVGFFKGLLDKLEKRRVVSYLGVHSLNSGGELPFERLFGFMFHCSI